MFIINQLSIITPEMVKVDNSAQAMMWQLPPLDEKKLGAEKRIERREKFPAIIFTLIGFFVAILIGTLTFRRVNSVILHSDDEIGTYQVLGSGAKKEGEVVNAEPIGKIAYISSLNVWIFDLEEGKNTQITGDGSLDVVYSALAWKDKDRLSFGRCTKDRCIIQTYSLKERGTTDALELEAETVVATRYSHRGHILALLVSDGKNLRLDVKRGGVTENLYEFSNSGKDVVDFNDAMYIRFSPDDERIMLVNTYAYLSEFSILVLDLSGAIVATVEKDDRPTFSVFSANDSIYFKKGNYLFARSLEDGKEEQLSRRIVNAYNIILSPDRTHLAYWTYDYKGGVTTTWVYEISTDKLKRLSDQYIFPQWTSENSIVALKIEPCYKCSIEGFVSKSLDIIDITDKSVTPLLEAENIKYFTAENL